MRQGQFATVIYQSFDFKRLQRKTVKKIVMHLGLYYFLHFADDEGMKHTLLSSSTIKARVRLHPSVYPFFEEKPSATWSVTLTLWFCKILAFRYTLMAEIGGVVGVFG